MIRFAVSRRKTRKIPALSSYFYGCTQNNWIVTCVCIQPAVTCAGKTQKGQSESKEKINDLNPINICRREKP